jgi:hypothetical protein
LCTFLIRAKEVLRGIIILFILDSFSISSILPDQSGHIDIKVWEYMFFSATISAQSVAKQFQG